MTHKLKSQLSIKILLFSISFLFQISCYATIWKVGSSRSYTLPSQVSNLVSDGDTVEIDAGIYPSDVCRWKSDNLLLKGIGGYAHLKSNGKSWGDKAIWVIQGNNISIEWIEFSECTSIDKNGAGIRGEGHNLTIRNCYFHHNENGILIGAFSQCTYLIEYCEFAYNGRNDGYTHNLYIGHIDTLIFQYNYSHHCYIGQELKSRAKVNYILYNRLSNERTGVASREIDLPNGGIAVILGNIIQQGVNGENSNLVGFGAEGLTNSPPHELYLINNTLVNEKGRGSFVAVNNDTDLYKGYNNIFAGEASLLIGTPTIIDTLANFYFNKISDVGFANSAEYDYRILATSPVINKSVDAGMTKNGYSLTSIFEYLHPADKILRPIMGKIDAGAHEYNRPVGINRIQPISIYTYSNTESLFVESDEKLSYIALYDLNGRLLLQSEEKIINIEALPNSIYILIVKFENGQHVIKKVRK